MNLTYLRAPLPLTFNRNFSTFGKKSHPAVLWINGGNSEIANAIQRVNEFHEGYGLTIYSAHHREEKTKSFWQNLKSRVTPGVKYTKVIDVPMSSRSDFYNSSKLYELMSNHLGESLKEEKPSDRFFIFLNCIGGDHPPHEVYKDNLEKLGPSESYENKLRAFNTNPAMAFAEAVQKISFFNKKFIFVQLSSLKATVCENKSDESVNYGKIKSDIDKILINKFKQDQIVCLRIGCVINKIIRSAKSIDDYSFEQVKFNSDVNPILEKGEQHLYPVYENELARFILELNPKKITEPKINAIGSEASTQDLSDYLAIYDICRDAEPSTFQLNRESFRRIATYFSKFFD